MKKRRPLHLLGFIILIMMFAFTVPSCSTSSHQTKQAARYSRQKTKQPRWNSTTSRTTTYYIKKHKHKKKNAPKKVNKRH